MKRSLRLMKEPDIDTRIVTTRAARNSPEIGPSFILKKGVSLRMSRIMTRNIIKIENRTIASLTVIAVETFFRFSPKKVPMRVCQVSEIMIVSFQAFVVGFGWLVGDRWDALGMSNSTGVIGEGVSARIVGKIRLIRINIMIPLFMF